ncbi:lipoprotein [Hymenobacter volaticus]|uniref:Lipoprotein n=1 Tax=Hymenobacter volaticus TaxID=2932254 RepID=A0ABY4G426_9BACT|nr:lipoprotein [Hymenobacter volaticus]UOQ65608.1 lipoprotein [Hymenobacter volaticus]
MKRLLLPAILVLILSGCQKDSENDVQPEDKDWYILTSPDNRAIQAVHGDIDGTLVITTNFKIYQTKDRGKTWQTANYTSPIGLFGFLKQQDTLLALNGQLGSALNSSTAYAVTPSHYSLDEGATWKPYRNWRRKADWEPKTALNRVTNSIGTEYSIDYLLTPKSPNSTSFYVESVGIKTSTGRTLSLPQEHQLTSLYIDSKSRLYVTGSAPLCGRRDKFAFCGEQNGTLYVSKNPQP